MKEGYLIQIHYEMGSYDYYCAGKDERQFSWCGTIGYAHIFDTEEDAYSQAVLMAQKERNYFSIIKVIYNGT